MKTTCPGEAMHSMKTLASLGRIFFILVFAISFYFILKNALLLSRDVLYGDNSVEKVRPVPQYKILRIQRNRWTRTMNAQNRLAIDFAQVYFPSREFDDLSKNYTRGEYDPLDRQSRYAPFVHYLCAISYCRLDYGPASLAHLSLQLVLFFISFTAAYFLLNIPRHLPLGILLVSAGLFLTPAGLSWFERGQFSLYVAMAYLFVILGILKREPLFFLLGGLFAFIKWTSFPTLFVILSTFFLASGSMRKLKENLLISTPFFIIILVLLAVFPRNGYYFMRGLYQQEIFANPGGVSLVKLLSVEVVKFIPIALIILGVLYIRKYRADMEKYLPFFAGVGIVMLTYPTLVFDYSVSTLFCFIPFLMYWADLQRGRRQAMARTAMKYTFFLFLLAASYSPTLVKFFNTDNVMYWVYALGAGILIFVPLIPSIQGMKSTPDLAVNR